MPRPAFLTPFLALTVNSVADPVESTNSFNQPQRRFVLVDWTATNEGTVNFDPFRGNFKLQTADGFLVDPGNHAGHREPDLATGVLGPGQLVRGFLVYDVPAGQRIRAAIFQPTGGRQFVVAEL